MKKLFVLILLLTGCTFQSQEERFVNPIFYKTLYPISKTVRETKLTPTKIYTKSVISEENCSLLKNTKNELVFSCEYDPPLGRHISDSFHRYVLELDKTERKNCYVVREETSHGQGWYCIHLDE